MKRLRILTIIIFLIAAGSYGYSEHKKSLEVDEEVPHIEMDSDTITVSVTDDEKALLAGITATDKKDGDITESLVVESLSNYMPGGKRKMTVVAFDSDNHATKATREVVYSDYARPRFELTQALYFPVGTRNITETIKANDVADGDISDRIKLVSDTYVDVEVPGDYPVKFIATNKGGSRINLPVTITIYDPEEMANKPVITLSKYLVYSYAKKKKPVNPWKFVESIQMNGMTFEKAKDGNLYQTNVSPDMTPAVITPDQLIVEGEVDYTKSNVYELTLKISSLAAGAYEGAKEYIGATRLVVAVR